MATLTRALVVTSLLASAGVACIGVLGVDEVFYTDRDGSADDASALDSSGDGAQGDAGADAAACRCLPGQGCDDAGLCMPIVLRPGLLSPHGFALGGGALYWIEGQGVKSCPADSGAPVTDVVGTAFVGRIADVVANDARVYWLVLTGTGPSPVSGAVRSCAHGTVDCQGGVFVVNGPDMQDIAVSATHFAWNEATDAGDFHVRTCVLPECDGGTTASPNPAHTQGIALSPISAFYVMKSDQLHALRLVDGADSLVTSAAAPIVYGHGFVYWIDDARGVVQRCPGVGQSCQPETVAASVVPSAIAADARGAYFAAVAGDAGSYVFGVAADASAARPVAQLPGGDVKGVAVDDEAVYVLQILDDAGAGRILKTAR